jgi:hypothetical protein
LSIHGGASSAALHAVREAILRTLEVVADPPDPDRRENIVEIRLPNSPKDVLAGYFSDWHRAAEEMLR